MTEVKRWVTQWPYHMQPIPGSSGVDWTKVEVVPAADYDALANERDQLQGLLDDNEYLKQLVAARDEAEAKEDEGKLSSFLDDGFGNRWYKCLRPGCAIEVVRPGKVQCSLCEPGSV